MTRYERKSKLAVNQEKVVKNKILHAKLKQDKLRLLRVQNKMKHIHHSANTRTPKGETPFLYCYATSTEPKKELPKKTNQNLSMDTGKSWDTYNTVILDNYYQETKKSIVKNLPKNVSIIPILDSRVGTKSLNASFEENPFK